LLFNWLFGHFNKVASVSNVAGKENFLIASIMLAIKDIVFDRIVEQGWLLHHKSHLGAKIPHIIGPDVYPVNKNLAKGHVVKSE